MGNWIDSGQDRYYWRVLECDIEPLGFIIHRGS